MLAIVAMLAGCAGIDERPATPGARPMTAAETRALIVRLLPPRIADRPGWAADLHAAFGASGIATTVENLCAAVAIIEQESSFRADPSVPNLAKIAWAEIERQRERTGVPRIVLDAALSLESKTGITYRERIDAVKTERELSEIFEDFIDRVPLGRRFLASRNPVRTGGPMQVSIAWSEARARAKPYPYPVTGGIRNEVFTRRGGLYFGVAHLLDYPARYDRVVYRFADFNAGHHASRNAAFQQAVTEVSGVSLALDGDLLVGDGSDERPSATELAVRTLGPRLGLGNEAIRRDLRLGTDPGFAETRLWKSVFALAAQSTGRTPPIAVLPKIELKSPKITQPFTTERFANAVDRRHRACLARAQEPAATKPAG